MSPRVRRRGYRLATLAVVALVGLAVVTGGAAAHGPDDGYHHHDGPLGMHDGGWWGWRGLGWLWMLLPLTLLVALPLVAVLVLRGGGDDGDADPAVDRLRERYAAGDIDDEEFQRRRERLQDS